MTKASISLHEMLRFSSSPFCVHKQSFGSDITHLALSFRTKELFKILKRESNHLSNDVYEKIRHKEATSLQSKSWTADDRALSLILQKSARDELQAYLEVPTGLSKTKAQEITVATTLAPKRKDYIERALYAKLSGWSPGMLKFRNEGPLLPFGAPTALFNIPNP